MNAILLTYTVKPDLRGHIWDKEKVANAREGLTVYIYCVLIRYRNIIFRKKTADNIGINLLIATGIGIAAHAVISAKKHPKGEE